MRGTHTDVRMDKKSDRQIDRRTDIHTYIQTHIQTVFIRTDKDRERQRKSH
jgi:hypothetical protein